MRLSRKAGALACDIRWIKYACTDETIEYITFSRSAWQTSKRGTNAAKTYTGFADYIIRLVGDEYQYVGYQNTVTTISTDKPGSVYEFAERDSFWVAYRYTIDGVGNYSEAYQTLFTNFEYESAYTVGEQVGAVYSANGEYPDVKNGYTYVTVFEGYTIMKDSDENYFAYVKA